MAVFSPQGDLGLRLWYEAFARLSAELSKAANMEEFTRTLASQLKYLLHAKHARFCLQLQDKEVIVITISQGQGTYTLRDQGFCEMEEVALAKGVPAVYQEEQLVQMAQWAEHPFRVDGVSSVGIYPLPRLPKGHDMVITLGSKDEKALGSLDFRTVGMLGDFVRAMGVRLHLEQTLQQQNEEIAKLNQGLEELVEERTDRLKQANSELSQLFYHSSHRMKRPLTTALGLVNLLELGFQEPKPEHALLQSELRGMVSMLERLGQLTYLHGDEPAPKPYASLHQIVEEILSTLQTQYPNHTLRYQKDYEQELTLPIPVEYLQICLTELFDNCFRYARNQEVIIQMGAATSDYGAALEISDQGVGVDPTLVPQLFEMYFHTGHPNSGHGLGLFLAKRFVNHLGGLMDLQSSGAGRGTTVQIWLPYSTQGAKTST